MCLCPAVPRCPAVPCCPDCSKKLSPGGEMGGEAPPWPSGSLQEPRRGTGSPRDPGLGAELDPPNSVTQFLPPSCPRPSQGPQALGGDRQEEARPHTPRGAVPPKFPGLSHRLTASAPSCPLLHGTCSLTVVTCVRWDRYLPEGLCEGQMRAKAPPNPNHTTNASCRC